MTPRIKELIELAELEGIADLIDCNVGEDGAGMEILARFARLIAHDCMSIADAVHDRDIDEEKIWPEETYIDGFKSGAKATWQDIERNFIR